MTYALLIRPLAESDLNAARRWYGSEAPHKLDDFEFAFDDVFARIIKHPLLFPAKHHELRQAPVPGFPYYVWYLVTENQNLIEVVAVIHDRQEREQFRERD